MNNIEDNPNGQEGLSGEPSPSEIINQMVDKLGELLRDTLARLRDVAEIERTPLRKGGHDKTKSIRQEPNG